MEWRIGESDLKSMPIGPSPAARRWHALLCAPLLAVVLIAAWTYPARASHLTIVNNGPNANRVNVVFLGDGYTASQINTLYPAHINSMLNYMFNQGEQPFVRYKNFFNVHRVNVISNQSGADVAPENIFRDTALDARYFFDGTTDRLLYVSESKANAALNSALSHAGFAADMRIVTVNDTRYGGGGGSWAVYAGGNSSANEVALHELGHSFAGLADEYGGFTTVYNGAEPNEVNVTRNSTGAKWSQWIGYNQPGIGIIGAYEGGRYYDRGIYRPSQNSKMRSLNRPFDAVSREEIILDIFRQVDPLDAWLGNTALLTDPASLWVDRIDPAVISLEWFVNGVKVPGAIGETFRLLDHGFGIGTFSVRARAFDPTGFDPVNGWVRRLPFLLEQSITWNVTQTVPEPSTIVLIVVGLMGLVVVRIRLRDR